MAAYAIDYLGRVIRLAGYRSKETIKRGDSFEERFTNKLPIQDNVSDLSGSDSKSPPSFLREKILVRAKYGIA